MPSLLDISELPSVTPASTWVRCISSVYNLKVCVHGGERDCVRAVCPPFATLEGQECVCPSGKYWTGDACCPFSSTWNASIGNCVCNPTHVWDGNTCACPSGTVWNGKGCCPPFARLDGTQCVCPAGMYYTGTACCVYDSVWVGSGTTGNCA